LVDKSLATVEVHSVEVRYRLLEPVRKYGEQKLADRMELDDARRRVASFYVDYSRKAEPLLHGPNQAHWLSLLDGELDGMRAAVHWALEQGDADMVMDIAAPLQWYFWMRHHLREGQRWLEGALAKESEALPAARGNALAAAAFVCSFLGEHQKGLAFGREALYLYENGAPAQERSWLLTTLAYLSLGAGEIDEAGGLAEQALDAGQQAGSGWHSGHAQMMLGHVARQTGDGEAASRFYLDSLAAFESVGDTWAILAVRTLAALDEKERDPWRQGALTALRMHWERGDQRAAIGALEYVAGRFQTARPEIQVTLLAAARAARSTLGAHAVLVVRDDVECQLEAARAALGEPRYAAAWKTGTGLELSQVVESLLSSRGSGLDLDFSAGRKPPSEVPGGLTRREWQVTQLLARGRTDREIAEELVITRGTASLHVHHILRKLGLRSRAQVADWCRGHDLLDPT
jgi:DNA-binding NarL/FixJ family response regulator